MVLEGQALYARRAAGEGGGGERSAAWAWPLEVPHKQLDGDTGGRRAHAAASGSANGSRAPKACAGATGTADRTADREGSSRAVFARIPARTSTCFAVSFSWMAAMASGAAQVTDAF
jgi:hypothetical protein